MKIALDYDKTFTADPMLWLAFVQLARESGHEVAIVTFRRPDREGGNDRVHRDAKLLGVKVFFAAGRPKAAVYDADIWIDDFPALIPTPEQIALIPEISERVLKNKSRAYEDN